MPFKSQAQRAFMYENHPGLAKRWERLTPKNRDLPKHDHSESESEETNKPGVPRLPRKNGSKRDFGGLRPNPQARHRESHPSNEKESMEEKPVEASNAGEKGILKLRYHDESRLQGRDIKQAVRRS